MNTLEGELSLVGIITNAFRFDVTIAVTVLCLMIIAGAATKKTTEVSAKSHWIHKREVPRFGGLAIILGLTYLFLANDPTLNSVSYALLLSSAPLVLTGISEDIGKEIKPSQYRCRFCLRIYAVLLTDSDHRNRSTLLIFSWQFNNCYPAFRLCINNHCAQLQSH